MMWSGGSQLNIAQWLQWSPQIIAVFIAYLAADVTALYARQFMLPQGVSRSAKSNELKSQPRSRAVYASIADKNVFNADGVIPPPLTANGDESTDGEQKEADPVPSQLPLSLLGTIVHGNPERSVATIEIKGRNRVTPFQVGDEIDGMAEVTAIERHKVIFRNLKNNGRLEYIELKLVSKIKFGSKLGDVKDPEDSDTVVQTRGKNKFEIKRDDILRYTNDLPALLQEARAVPNRDPQTGEVNGFRVLDIKQDSIFGELGIQRMDVIKSVNGQAVNSPKKAMELYQALRNESKIEIGIERNGRTETLDYNIK